jgi:RNA polymerase sigma-70 factor (ECF subfamily)
VIEEQLRGLLISGLEGDAHAYHAFLDQLSGHLRSFLMRRLSGIPDEVEDIVQESLLAIHDKRHTYDRSQPIGAWAFAIARYKLVDFFRRREIKDSLSDHVEDEHEFFLSTNMDAAEAHRDIMKLLGLLPDRQRIPIEFTKLNGFSVEETVRMTGMSESAIKVGVHRGLKALVKAIRDDHENN